MKLYRAIRTNYHHGRLYEIGDEMETDGEATEHFELVRGEEPEPEPVIQTPVEPVDELTQDPPPSTEDESQTPTEPVKEPEQETPPAEDGGTKEPPPGGDGQKEPPSSPPSEEERLNAMELPELHVLAKERGLTLHPNTGKPKVIAALLADEADDMLL